MTDVQPSNGLFALDEQFDASDPVAVRKRQNVAKKRDAERRGVVRSLMATPEGRRWVWTC